MRRKEPPVYEHKASSKEYLLALAYFPLFVKQLNSENKPYFKLVAWLLENEKALLNEDQRLPSMLDIAKATNIDYSKVAKYLKSIYDDIHELNSKEPMRFAKPGQRVYNLSFDYIGCFASFNLGLDESPRVGDGFDFDFIRPRNGGRSFSVRSVHHYIDNDEHSIYISLTSESPNKYLDLLKDKAYLEGTISFLEHYRSTSLSLEEKLLKTYRHL